ncbi:MAG: MerC domain-containing protein [Planctomycetes bacterium]|nr:MerC domain-containing protein [Planctomycetota bacterium]
MGPWKDRLGIFASVACAIHCAVTPFLIASLPALKLTEWMASPLFHQIAAVACSVLVAIAIWPSFARFRDYRILGLSTAGLSFIIASAFLLPDACCSNAAQCSEDHCEETSAVAGNIHNHSQDHSHADHTHGDTAVSAPSPELATASFAAPIQFAATWLQPWMTPIGGLLLIIAHGVNLRRRTQCSLKCCSAEESVEDPNNSHSLLEPRVSSLETSRELAKAS